MSHGDFTESEIQFKKNTMVKYDSQSQDFYELKGQISETFKVLPGFHKIAEITFSIDS